MRKYSFLAFVLILLFILPACGKGGSKKAASPADVNTIEKSTFTKDDYYTQINEDKATAIVFSESGITYDGSPVEGNTVEITKGGAYVLSGKSPDARVIISAGNKKSVRLLLSGLELTSTSGAPIYTKTEAKTIISLADNSANILSDVAGLTDTKVTSALHCMGDLTINGGGSLSVSGNTCDAITSRGVLKLMGGTVNASAVGSGLIGADGFILHDGSLSIKSGASGISTLNGSSKKLGFIQLLGGNATIVSTNNAISSANSIYARGGTYSVTTSGSDGPAGLISPVDIKIAGGDFSISADGKAVCAGENLLLDGGSITMNCKAKALSAGRSVIIQNTDINITSSIVGIESRNISILGGNVAIDATETGINAHSEDDGACSLIISGGETSVITNDTGINSDGSISMSGGTLSVSAPNLGENNAINYDDKFELSGGTLIAAGSPAEFELPSGASKQNIAVFTFKNTVHDGSCVTIKDELSNVVISHTAPRQFSTLLLSTPNLKLNTKYSLFLGDMKLTEFTLKSKTSLINTTKAQTK